MPKHNWCLILCRTLADTFLLCTHLCISNRRRKPHPCRPEHRIIYRHLCLPLLTIAWFLLVMLMRLYFQEQIMGCFSRELNPLRTDSLKDLELSLLSILHRLPQRYPKQNPAISRRQISLSYLRKILHLRQLQRRQFQHLYSHLTLLGPQLLAGYLTPTLLAPMVYSKSLETAK
jgi:hypothetical protein